MKKLFVSSGVVLFLVVGSCIFPLSRDLQLISALISLVFGFIALCVGIRFLGKEFELEYRGQA